MEALLDPLAIRDERLWIFSTPNMETHGIQCRTAVLALPDNI